MATDISRSIEERERAGTELQNYFQSLATEDQEDNKPRPNNDINKRIFEYLRSQDVNAQLGGILAIDKLLDVYQADEMSAKVTRFSNYLRSVIPTSNVEVLRAAVNTMAKLTQYDGLASEIVEFEITRAIEWLQSDRQESRRHSAILMITALAKSSPTLLYSYVTQIMEVIWVGLRDPKVTIRIYSADALSACLKILIDRDSATRQYCYVGIMEESQAGFRIGTTEAIHGSLLAYKELLENAGMFMQPRYSDVCEMVLKYKDSKDTLIRQTVVRIIPDLAKYNPIDFTKKYLSDSMTYLFHQFKKERDRALVFMSIGKIALSVRSNIAFYLDLILEHVKDSLNSKG